MRNIFDTKDNLHEKDEIPAVLKWGNLYRRKPDVSILMPVYNHPHFFKKALETAINQDYKGEFEIVILDNNKDDDVSIINEFEQYVIEKDCSKILYYKNEHNILGINSYNRLPQLANADYFTFLHDDDELCPNCLSELFRIKKKHALTKELIVPLQYCINRDSTVIITPSLIKNGFIWQDCYKMAMYDWFIKNHTNGCGTLHHRDSFLELGGYCADYIPTADYAFYSLYSYKFGSVLISKPLFKYRIAENDSINVYEKCVEMILNIKKDMIPVINMPPFFLKRIIQAHRLWNLERLDKLFSDEKQRKAPIMDKIISIVAVFFRIIIHL